MISFGSLVKLFFYKISCKTCGFVFFAVCCVLYWITYLESFYFISLTLFSVGLTNSYSKITNKYQLKQKYKISIDFKINI